MTLTHGFDRGVAPPAIPERQRHEPSPADKAEAAKTIAANLDSIREAVGSSIATMRTAAERGDAAAWGAARKTADNAIAVLGKTVEAAKTSAADAADPALRENLASADAIRDEVTALAGSAPPQPAPRAPGLTCESALLAALPPDEPVPNARQVFDQAQRDVEQVFRTQMAFSDITALKAIWKEHAEHPLTRRFQRFGGERQVALRAILDDAKVRAKARALDASRAQSAPAAAGPSIGTATTEVEPTDASPTVVREEPTAEAGTGAVSTELPHRDRMEALFDQDFGGVTAQLGASDALDPMGAEAAAHGDSVSFASDNPDPGLVAHELTHVVQQRQAGAEATAASGTLSGIDDAAEVEARGVASHVAAGGQGPIHVQAAPSADIHLSAGPETAYGPQTAPPPVGSLDPAAEATLLGLFDQLVAADDAAGIQARVRQLTSAVRAVPSTARPGLHDRLAAPRAGDALASAFTHRIHHATQTKLLAALQDRPVALPTRHDAMTKEAFAAKLPADPFTIEPAPLVIHPRFAPTVTAHLAMHSEFGPAADEPGVTVATRVFDPDAQERPERWRVEWPSAAPVSKEISISFGRPGVHQIDCELIQSGLVIAQRQRTVEIVQPTPDLEADPAGDMTAAMNLSPEQLQAAHARMGDQLGGDMSPEQRAQLGNDRNLLEFAASSHAVSLEREVVPERAVSIDAGSRMTVSAEPAFVRNWIEQTFLRSGLDAVTALPDDVLGFADNDIMLDMDDPMQGEYVRNDVIGELRVQIARFKSEITAFEGSFTPSVKSTIRATLAESRRQANAELSRYGITTETEEFDVDLGPGDSPSMPRHQHVKTTKLTGGGDNEESQAMATAAAQLVANQRQIEEMHERLEVAELALAIQGGDPRYTDPTVTVSKPGFDDASKLADGAGDLFLMIESLQHLVADAEMAHEATILQHTDHYPLLARYKKQRYDRVEVDAGGLDRLQGGGRAQEIYSQINPALENIELTEQALDAGELDVWKEPRMLSIAMAQQAIAPGSLHAKMVEVVQKQHAGGGWEQWATMALTFGLALLTAIPTGGSSVVGAVVVAAEIGGAVLDIYMLSDEIREFQLDQAKSGTDLDKARAISMNEPDFLWLALDIVATGIGLKMASSTFKEVTRDLARARAVATAGRLGEAEADVAIANVHRAARDGRLSADAAQQAEQEIRAGAAVAEDGAGKATRIDARAHVTPDRIDELSTRLGLPVEIDESGKLGSGVELHYERGSNGDIQPTVVKVGPDALIDDILAHRDVIPRITRYNGKLGKLRRLWDRLVVMFEGGANVPRSGAAWESYQELAKIDDLIATREAARMGKGVVDPEVLDHEIEFLEGYRLHHEGVVAEAEQSGKYGEPVGHIDSPDWRDGVGREDARSMHEVDPLGQDPHQKRLPKAKDIDPSVPPDRANSGFWDDEHAAGNTNWNSDNAKVNKVTHGQPIVFKDGYPVLDEYTQETVYLKKMKGNQSDFAPCDRELAQRQGWLTAAGEPDVAAAKLYRKKNRLTWHHHQDGVRMQLVPRDLHANIPHAGGASAAREAEEDVDVVD